MSTSRLMTIARRASRLGLAALVFAVIVSGVLLAFALIWVKVVFVGVEACVDMDDEITEIESMVATLTLRETFGAGSVFAWRFACDVARVPPHRRG